MSIIKWNGVCVEIVTRQAVVSRSMNIKTMAKLQAMLEMSVWYAGGSIEDLTLSCGLVYIVDTHRTREKVDEIVCAKLKFLISPEAARRTMSV